MYVPRVRSKDLLYMSLLHLCWHNSMGLQIQGSFLLLDMTFDDSGIYCKLE